MLNFVKNCWLGDILPYLDSNASRTLDYLYDDFTEEDIEGYLENVWKKKTKSLYPYIDIDSLNYFILEKKYKVLYQEILDFIENKSK